MALTPDEVAARNAGYAMPEGTHYIREGDDAIRTNAVTAFDQRYVRGTFNSDTNIDALADGVHKPAGASSASSIGIPVPAAGNDALGELWVSRAFDSETYKIIEWRGLMGATYVNRKHPNGWTGWQPLHPTSGVLTLEHDLDDLTEDADWTPPDSSVAAALGIPVGASGLEGVGRLRVRRALTNPVYSAYVMQTWEMLDGSRIRRVLWGNQWRAWERATAGGDGLAMRHEMLKDDFTRRIGAVSTAGRSAVTLRFDHGLTNFKNTILPLLRARGLTATVAMNSRTWDAAENSGTTQAEADSWTDIEFANHSATHQDAPTYTDQVDEIVTGRDELAAQLPDHRINGFILPGVGGTQYGGFGIGSSPTEFADSTAGRLILGHHAWSTGHIAGTKNRTLDGRIRQGQDHYTYESASVQFVKNEIDATINLGGRGLVLMMHPRLLNTSGYITTAQLTEILDYIVQRRDAGDLVNLTLSEMMVADATATVDTGPVVGTPSGYAIDPDNTGTIELRRRGDVVHCRVNGVMVSAGAQGTWLWGNGIPLGYRPNDYGQVVDVPAGYQSQDGINNASRHRIVISGNDLYYVGYLHGVNAYEPGPARDNGTRRIYGFLPPWITDDPAPAS